MGRLVDILRCKVAGYGKVVLGYPKSALFSVGVFHLSGYQILSQAQKYYLKILPVFTEAK